ncbi:MAG: 23S rRNA (guanosine(2251)-2'-O)-methyltransferase RlmB [Actinomycetota bacterium]|nr:23S rRNA (guanosine(2251)-2'-O)-methyltransferase RlmB [Actinomycetota bacterium]
MQQRGAADGDRKGGRGGGRGARGSISPDRRRRREHGHDASKAAVRAAAEWPERRADDPFPPPERASISPPAGPAAPRRASQDRSGRAVPGLQPVRELLRAHVAGSQHASSPREICVASVRRPSPILSEILALAARASVPVSECAPSQLAGLAGEVAHQGVVAIASPYHYLRLGELLGGVPSDETSLLVALDGVTDPHNLGSVARTAEAVGAHGLIVPARRAAGVGPAAEKSAAGAFSHLRVARVPNLTRALGELAQRRIWTVGLDAEAAVGVHDCELLGEAVAIVVGAEGRGLSRLVASRCDVLAALDMRGQVGSLNTSVAAAVTLYEALRRRRSR